MKNRNFWLSLVLLISLGVTAIDITRAVNPPMPTIPGECEFLRAPTSSVLGSRQTPDPVEVGDTFTVEWHVTGDGGGYIPAHPDKNSPPPEQPLDKWGTHGKRFDGEGSADFWTEPVTYRARLTGSTTVEYFFGDLNYFNPCDKSYHTANTPTAIHTPNIIPRPPGDPPPDPPTGDDPPPPPGVPPLPEEGEGGTNTGTEKPDHGEVLGDGEIIDEDSIVTDPDRGDIPTSGKVLVFLDPAPATPEALPGGNDFERIVLTHRIVTINSPDARPLDGTLRLEVVEGDPENFEIHYFDPENSAAQEITSFPFEEMITEPGHHGGGVHDWHSGTVSLNVRAISRPESPEEEPHLILRASADPVQGAPKKTLDVVLLPVEIKVFRPQEVQGAEQWQLTRQKKVIPSSEIDEKKIGIRVNKDGDDGGSENDLIEVEFTGNIPSGIDLVIKRSNSNLSVYAEKDKTGTILTTGSETTVGSPHLPPRSYWVECTDPITDGNIEFFVSSGGTETKIITLPFRSFTTVVTSLSGETGFGADPLTHGTYDISEALYLKGYNVHYYDEGQESRCIAEMDDQGDKCGVEKAAVFGYSHGGGSTYRVADAAPGGLSLEFTGYIDAVTNRFMLTLESEERRPPGSGYHFNYYQTNGLFNGEPSVPSADLEKDLTSTMDHGSIDNDPGVIADLISSLESNIAP